MVTMDEFKKLELRVAEVVEVKDHPNADRLYVLTVRVGEETKTIVAGVRKYYTAEELKGKKIILVNNLEPAVIRGVESQGMMLAASADETLTVVIPERAIASGSVVR